jgi:hypothetical protein
MVNLFGNLNVFDDAANSESNENDFEQPFDENDQDLDEQNDSSDSQSGSDSSGISVKSIIGSSFVKDLEPTSSDSNKQEPSYEIDEREAVNIVANEFYKKLGWERDEEDVYDNIDELVEHVLESIADSTKPEYSDPRLAQMDEYIRRGGSLEDLLNHYAGIKEEALIFQPQTPEQQKQLLYQFYKETTPFTDQKIIKLINNADRTGELENEAKDAYHGLKQLRAQRQEQLRQQELYEQERRMQEYANRLEQNKREILSMDSHFFQWDISEKDKRQLAEFIYDVDENGQTKLQKQLAQNPKLFHQVAYLAMKGLTNPEKISKALETKSASKVQTSLSKVIKRYN